MSKSKKKFSLASDVKLNEEIAFLHDKTKKPKIQILHDCIDNMVQVASRFKGFNYWVVLDRNEPDSVTVMFFGDKALAIGQKIIREQPRVFKSVRSVKPKKKAK